LTHVLVVFTNAKEGRDEAFNEWYTNRHLADLLQIEGVRAAQRFEVSQTQPPQSSPYKYMAIYEVEDGSLEAVKGRLRTLGVERADAVRDGREPRLPVSDAMHEDRVAIWFDAITERRESEQHAGAKHLDSPGA